MGFLQRLLSLFWVTVSQNEPMSKRTSYGVGGPAKYYVTVYSVKALRDVIELCLEYKVNYKIIGNGTNLLFSDKGFDGVVISTKGLNTLRHDKGKIYAMSGVTLCDLVLFSAEYNLYGGEALMGIPATVGGAIVMNAGAFGSSLGDFIKSVTTVKNGKLCVYDKEECEFGYRKSIFLGLGEPIISAEFDFINVPNGEISKELIDKCKNSRKQNQPSGKSCGCVFKNPTGDYAGRIIDQAGLKGFELGRASVSQKHANFIVTKPGATSSEVYLLIKYIKEKIKSEFNISLQEEVEFVGEF